MVIPVPRHLRNGRGAWLLVGVPWLAAIAARGFHRIGAFTLFLMGDDTLTYQRFAYRIFHDGYWLEGGQRTFWNQPLYRWICGSLHVVFGDSSVGELFVDGFALLLGAIFAFHVARRLSGFRGGLAAAVAVLLTVTLGPNWYLIGRGLSEMAAAGWLYGAALMVMRARRGSVHTAAAAGVLGFLAFVTRLNHLPIVVALVALLLPVRGEWVDLRRPTLRTLVRWRAAAAYLAVLACGIAAFAVRTWYYTGVLSLFAGTTRVHNATGLGLTLESMLSRDAWRNAFESVLMIVTVADPPRLDPRAALVIAGVALALLRVVRLKGVSTRVALGPAVVCVSALAAGLFVRGLAYPGRFSIHLIPVAVAISVGALATRWAALHPRQRHAAAPVGATEFVR
jgi:hypothetical protein